MGVGKVGRGLGWRGWGLRVRGGGQGTVAYYIAVLVFGDCEEGGPVDKVVHVEIDIVVFGEGIEIGEIHVEEILRAEGAEGCHVV